MRLILIVLVISFLILTLHFSTSCGNVHRPSSVHLRKTPVIARQDSAGCTYQAQFAPHPENPKTRPCQAIKSDYRKCRYALRTGIFCDIYLLQAASAPLLILVQPSRRIWLNLEIARRGARRHGQLSYDICCTYEALNVYITDYKRSIGLIVFL